MLLLPRQPKPKKNILFWNKIEIKAKSKSSPNTFFWGCPATKLKVCLEIPTHGGSNPRSVLVIFLVYSWRRVLTDAVQYQ